MQPVRVFNDYIVLIYTYYPLFTYRTESNRTELFSLNRTSLANYCRSEHKLDDVYISSEVDDSHATVTPTVVVGGQASVRALCQHTHTHTHIHSRTQARAFTDNR